MPKAVCSSTFRPRVSSRASSALTLRRRTRIQRRGRSARPRTAVTGSTEITASPDPFENSTATAEWRFDRRRTSIGVGVDYSRPPLRDADFARQHAHVLQRRHRAPDASDACASYCSATTATRISTTPATKRTTGWRGSRSTGASAATSDWKCACERYSRSSTDGISDFKENRAYLGFTFQRRSRTGRAGRVMSHLNAMTVDVEDYFHVSALAEVDLAQGLGDAWSSAPSRAPTDCSRCSREKNMKATFFVLGWVAQTISRADPPHPRRGSRGRLPRTHA